MDTENIAGILQRISGATTPRLWNKIAERRKSYKLEEVSQVVATKCNMEQTAATAKLVRTPTAEADVNHSGCSEKDKSDAKDAVGALGILVAYLHGFGFLVVILGITASALGCCICCKCCKMKDDAGAAGGQQPAVIGQPVQGQPC